MAHTIKGFQIDRAETLSQEIDIKINEFIAVDRIVTALQTYGVVNDHTYWRKLPQVLEAFGIDYDEIVEVAP
ncbi:hypothetical protein SEA_WELCOME_91 [Microbacterium phage Welcome]|nr:hypothetical protein SEA_WELCOME_91 [Microbacterium phage Welcome]